MLDLVTWGNAGGREIQRGDASSRDRPRCSFGVDDEEGVPAFLLRWSARRGVGHGGSAKSEPTPLPPPKIRKEQGQKEGKREGSGDGEPGRRKMGS